MNATVKFLLAVALTVPLFCGCGGDDDADPTVDVTGTWRGTSTFAGETGGETIQLTQSGANVTGVDSDGINYAGSVSGNELDLYSSMSNGADALSLDVSGTVEGNVMVLSGRVRGSVEGLSVDGPITYNLRR